jgi:hypothetical protein
MIIFISLFLIVVDLLVYRFDGLSSSLYLAAGIFIGWFCVFILALVDTHKVSSDWSKFSEKNKK